MRVTTKWCPYFCWSQIEDFFLCTSVQYMSVKEHFASQNLGFLVYSFTVGIRPSTSFEYLSLGIGSRFSTLKIHENLEDSPFEINRTNWLQQTLHLDTQLYLTSLPSLKQMIFSQINTDRAIVFTRSKYLFPFAWLNMSRWLLLAERITCFLTSMRWINAKIPFWYAMSYPTFNFFSYFIQILYRSSHLI